MIKQLVKFLTNTSSSHTTLVHEPNFSALIDLDRHTLEDIGVSPEAVAMSSPLKAARCSAGVIASGHSARWSLSSDWDVPHPG